jgi:hypothetical protein
MNSVAQQIAEQVRQNYQAFREKLPTLRADHRDQFSLMKDGELVGFFASAMEAYVAGEAQFLLGGFSMQKVVDAPIDLGYFSRAPWA